MSLVWYDDSVAVFINSTLHIHTLAVHLFNRGELHFVWQVRIIFSLVKHVLIVLVQFSHVCLWMVMFRWCTWKSTYPWLRRKQHCPCLSVCMSISCLCNGFNSANIMTHHCTLSLCHLKPLHILKINLATSISTPLMPRHYLTDVLKVSLDIFWIYSKNIPCVEKYLTSWWTYTTIKI